MPSICLNKRLHGLFPSPVVVAELRGVGEPLQLLPDEALAVSRAVPKRVNEFAAGRACARTALAEFGLSDFALLAADDRQPIWPKGFVGSITHTTGLCAAAVAQRSRIAALGLDSEIVGAPTPDIWSMLCRDEELAWVDLLPTAQRGRAVTLLFSAKEAFYKCQYPLTHEWLNFHDVHIEAFDWGQPHGIFMVRATRSLRFAQHAVLPLEGHYVFHEQFVSTGVTVDAGQ